MAFYTYGVKNHKAYKGPPEEFGDERTDLGGPRKC